MNDFESIFNRMGETLQSFSPYYREGMIGLMQETEAPEMWFPLNYVRAAEPQLFSLAQALDVNPYTALSAHRERYEGLAAEGWLEALGDGTYRLSEKGRKIIEGFFRIAHEALAEVEALPADKMNRLASLLQRIVASAVDSPEPALKLALLGSRWTDPGPDATAATRIDQYVTDLLRYRDDAHIGAWRPTGVDGKTWEALTLLWRGDAGSAAEVSDRLSDRGHEQDACAEALKTLQEKQWITLEGDGLQITDKGKRVRQEAEDETDRLFYAGWSALSSSELAELDDLLSRLNAKLRANLLSLCWTQARELSRAIFPVTREAVNDEFNKYFNSPRAFFPTLMAFGAQPDALTVSDYNRRFPYTKPERARALLGEAAASGCLSAKNGSFSITGKGQEAIIRVNDVFYKRLGEIDPLTEEESAELLGLLDKLVESTLETGEPEAKWALVNMHNCHTHKQYGSLALIDQAIDDLGAFRDDVHIASWQAHEVSGRDWDALTAVWREEACTAEALAEEMEIKGYSADEYAVSLGKLAGRGWLEKSTEGFQITDRGWQIRQEAEVTTDRLFFAPWQEMASDRLLRLHTLLIQAKLGLQALTEDAA